MVARLHTTAMAAMLFTRLQRSATSAMGSENRAMVIDTTETSPPSSWSESPHSAFSAGNIETTIWRSMKSKVISRNDMAKAKAACRRGTSQRAFRLVSAASLASAATAYMGVPFRCAPLGQALGRHL